ncbi:MAG TPA: hypothetical protein VJV23_05385 [Candidatus Polarisedimenticolia bacterium]|nr:hypothetical protein [Candidatus Polarisedimenticolia bacterium]
MPLPPQARRRALLAALLCLPLLAGCPGRLTRPEPRAEPPVKPPPAVEQEMPPPAPPPIRSEAELAMDAAAKAEARGDAATAADLYARAARASLEAGRRGDALFSLAQLHLDPAGPVRDLPQAREALQRLVESAPAHSRVRESRAMLALLDELDEARGAAAGLRTEAETLRGDAAALRIELDKKDQELKSIKQVLMQKKP